MPPEDQRPEGTVPQFKSQPWTLFDTVVSTDYTPGSAVNAIGSTTPAISAQGEIVFFQSAGRTQATMPWYSNQNQQGTLSYGLEAWQMFFEFLFPLTAPYQRDNANDGQLPNTGEVGTTIGELIASTILQFGELELWLGQEMQSSWPLTRFAAGGGLWTQTIYNGNPQNALPEERNILKLPEPIEMPRTQAVWAKIRLAPESLAPLTQLGAALDGTYIMQRGALTPAPLYLTFPRLPYGMRFGLQGRRIKDTQYGQIAG